MPRRRTRERPGERPEFFTLWCERQGLGSFCQWVQLPFVKRLLLTEIISASAIAEFESHAEELQATARNVEAAKESHRRAFVDPCTKIYCRLLITTHDGNLITALDSGKYGVHVL